MTVYDLFKVLIALHIATGAPGLVGFWVPVFAKKGGERHRWWGRLFAAAMIHKEATRLMPKKLAASAA